MDRGTTALPGKAQPAILNDKFSNDNTKLSMFSKLWNTYIKSKPSDLRG